MNLSLILPHLLYTFSSEHELLLAIEELSFKFTQEREKISDYLKDARLASAYTAFYLTTNIPKLEAACQWLPVKFVQHLRSCDLIDLGAGPGTFSIAWKEMQRELAGSVYQLETSSIMRTQARKIWDALYPDTTMIQLERWGKGSGREKFLLFGHSANEMGAAVAINYIKTINPEHILFIEPGTKAFFPEMLRIREYLLQHDYQVLYPCPAADTCPMQDGSDWCHQFIHVQQDPAVERLGQIIKKDRKLLPLTLHAYSRPVRPEPRDRIVRVYPETKFSYEWDVCTASPGQAANRIERQQVMKRGLDKSQQKQFSQVLAGSAVTTQLEKELEQGKRVKVIKLD